MNSKILDLIKRKKSTWKLYFRKHKADIRVFPKYKELEKQLLYATRRAKRQKENAIATEGKRNPRQT